MPDRRSDEQLVLATLAGDREAFGELVARHRATVFGVANRRLGDSEAASDTTQETFLKAYLSLADLRDPARFSSWLRTIAERAAIAAGRRPRREIPTAGLKLQDERSYHQYVTEQTELTGRLRDHLSALSEPTRKAVILYHLNGYSQDEVAERLGLTRSAVKTRLSRARSQLRRRRKRKAPRRSMIGRTR